VGPRGLGRKILIPGFLGVNVLSVFFSFYVFSSDNPSAFPGGRRLKGMLARRSRDKNLNLDYIRNEHRNNIYTYDDNINSLAEFAM
jgi:hypothetical protein